MKTSNEKITLNLGNKTAKLHFHFSLLNTDGLVNTNNVITGAPVKYDANYENKKVNRDRQLSSSPNLGHNLQIQLILKPLLKIYFSCLQLVGFLKFLLLLQLTVSLQFLPNHMIFS